MIFEDAEPMLSRLGTEMVQPISQYLPCERSLNLNNKASNSLLSADLDQKGPGMWQHASRLFLWG